MQAERRVLLFRGAAEKPAKIEDFAELAQLVERRLPKPQVTSSNLAFRSLRHLAAWQGAFFVLSMRDEGADHPNPTSPEIMD